MPQLFWILLVIILVLAAILVMMYNGLVSLRNRVKNAYAQMDVQMKNRADLIPGLVETVKGAAGHERGALEAVIKARSAVMNAQTPEQSMAANEQLTSTLNRLMLLVESYPDLKANANFQQLMSELKSAEEKIRYSRQFYNDTVMKYNNKIQVFPSNLVAGLFGFHAEKFFEITESERQVPKVDFSGMYDANYNKNDAYRQKAPQSSDGAKDPQSLDDLRAGRP
ncbi:LemA protein [Clostridiaceae bacterium JG1575]|nr:LemA protein [Clostridiaceae bacterium JG1575]